MPKVKLIDTKAAKVNTEWGIQHGSRWVVAARECVPFFINPRGVLAHRIKGLFSLVDGIRESHMLAEYWCESGRTFKRPAISGMLSADTRGRILCERCETLAVRAGFPPASVLVGQHVCVGGVRPYRTCCQSNATDQEA